MPARFIVADVFDGLASLETGSVDVVITSPPFLALRSYLPADHELKGKEIGSEATPAEFIDTLLKVTAELRRVLAPHGSICVELGDTYAGSSMDGGDQKNLRDGMTHRTDEWAAPIQKRGESIPGPRVKEGWPLAKSRTLIPSLYQIALAYGFNPLTGSPSPAGQWRIRNIITWARPNPPVGALGDKWRPATSDLIIACTSSKRFWDDLATRNPHKRDYALEAEATAKRLDQRNAIRSEVGLSSLSPSDAQVNSSGAPLLDYWVIPLLEGEEPKPYGPAEKRIDPASYTGNGYSKGSPEGIEGNESMPGNPAGAPLLDYWVIPPGGYTGSHYAVFPEELVVPCVQAMCPQKVCLTCGEPSRRIVDSERFQVGLSDDKIKGPLGNNASGKEGVYWTKGRTERTNAGWSDCGHDNWRPGLILDCFGGSGTTGMVATGHGHDAVLIDIDERNCDLARDRIGPIMFEGPIYPNEQPPPSAPVSLQTPADVPSGDPPG